MGALQLFQWNCLCEFIYKATYIPAFEIWYMFAVPKSSSESPFNVWMDQAAVKIMSWDQGLAWFEVADFPLHFLDFKNAKRVAFYQWTTLEFCSFLRLNLHSKVACGNRLMLLYKLEMLALLHNMAFFSLQV